MSARHNRRRRVEDDHPEHANHERWLVSYADMMTLLMVLFIVLFAVSQVDQKKFDALHQGLSTAFKASQPVVQGGSGILDGGRVPDHTHGGAQGANAVALSNPATPISPPAVLADLRREIQRDVTQEGLASDVSVGQDDRGVVLDIVTDRVLFPSGQSTLQPEGATVIDKLAPMLARLHNPLSIEGHTDNTPLTGTLSNWELSASRATVVLRRLLVDGVQADRLSASGFADTRPKVPNDTPAHRALNRRVSIVVLTGSAAAQDSSADPVEPASTRSSATGAPAAVPADAIAGGTP